ncbi:Transcription factor tau subunit sfc1 [Fulvia fulva]|nr:Transcription factor tau subunit sfc1 [Fulvia fulva]
MAIATTTNMARPRDQPTPVHSIPATRVVSIEHPGLVRNFDTGFKSLGGEAQLKHVLEHHVGDSKLSSKQNALPEPVAGVSLRPHDPLAKRIPSVGIESRNVLVKVTVPKRTGRKRKRGSNDPYTEDTVKPNTTSITAPDLVQRLRDNEANYTVKAVGLLRETHRFRTLPDFQILNRDIPIMKELRDHTMAADYDRLKNFRVDTSKGPARVDAYPGPPAFTHLDMPHKYEYQQASGVYYMQDESGQVISKNLAAPHRRLTWGLNPDCDEVPMKPPLSLPRRSPNGEMLPKAVKMLEKMLQDRPLVTKRVAMNNMPPLSDTIFKEATQYVGYSFKAGPWRDLLIRYGVDPRKDPAMRKYQTLMFQVDKEAFNAGPLAEQTSTTTPDQSMWSRPLRHTRDDPRTHIFDGKNITANGKTWQVCDVEDPLVKAIFDTEDIPTVCDVYCWGWYHNGTMSKARAIMKDKMRCLFAGVEQPEDVYMKVVEHIPDYLVKEKVQDLAVLTTRQHGARANHLATEVRNIIKGGEGGIGTKNRYHRPKRGQAAVSASSKAAATNASVSGGDGDTNGNAADNDAKEVDAGKEGDAPDDDDDDDDDDAGQEEEEIPDGEGDFQDMDEDNEDEDVDGDDDEADDDEDPLDEGNTEIGLATELDDID